MTWRSSIRKLSVLNFRFCYKTWGIKNLSHIFHNALCFYMCINIYVAHGLNTLYFFLVILSLKKSMKNPVQPLIFMLLMRFSTFLTPLSWVLPCSVKTMNCKCKHLTNLAQLSKNPGLLWILQVFVAQKHEVFRYT